MTTASIQGTLNQSTGSGSYGAATVNAGPDVVANATSADTNVGTVVTDNTTTLTALDAAAANIIAITGDTYVAHQFVFGGATGLTHAQWATAGALLNTAITDFLAAQAAAVAAKTSTALVKTDLTSDVTLTINLANVTTLNGLRKILREILDRVTGFGLALAA